jgi:chitin synthase
MIVAFTSTAFNNFVAQYIKTSGDSTFNPYLQFLFFAL